MASIEPWRWDLCRGCEAAGLRKPWDDCKNCTVTAWRCHWRDDRNRPQSKVVRRKVDARNHLKKVGADLERGEYIPRKLAASKFDEWADRWWKTTPKLSAHTRRGYYVLLERHVRPWFRGMAMDRIDWEVVEEFLNDKLAGGYAPKRVRDMVSVVSLVMKTAIRKGARKDNPAAQHTVPQRARKIRQGDVLDMDQALRLVANTRDPYKPAVWLLVLLGLRPAELCGLKIGAVDFARCEVHVAETLNAVHSFPGHTYGLEVEPTKTEAGDRVLPIPGWLRNDLASMVVARSDERGVAEVGPDEPLFESIKGGKPIRVADLRRWVIIPALKAAGMPVKLRTYDLRHSHASILIDQGANPLELAQRMGHTDPTVTLRVYGHLFEGAQHKLTNLLDAVREQALTASDSTVVPLRGHVDPPTTLRAYASG